MVSCFGSEHSGLVTLPRLKLINLTPSFTGSPLFASSFPLSLAFFIELLVSFYASLNCFQVKGLLVEAAFFYSQVSFVYFTHERFICNANGST